MQQYLQQSQSTSHHEDGDEDLNRALAESSADAERQKKSELAFDEDLERVLTASLKEQRGWLDESSTSSAGPSLDDPPRYDHLYPNGSSSDSNSKSTGKQTKQSFSSTNEKSAQEKSEEQIVMQYAKKQSLLEEEHRRAKATGGGTVAGSSQGVMGGEEDDEDLRRAIEESMKGSSSSAR
jgi:hypothetical protein